MSNFTNNIRQKRFAEKQKAQGYKRVQMWLKPEEKDFLDVALTKFRNGEHLEKIPEATQNFSLTESQNEITRKIKEGTFTESDFYIDAPSVPYYHDLLSAPVLHWNKPLPDALLVVADKRVSVKQWRAVSLKGLGAFPVVWSIIYALNRYAYHRMTQQSPRRRSFNLLSFKFESIVHQIIGYASMHADDRFKGTPLGFLTYQVSVSPLLVSSNINAELPDGILTVVVEPSGKLLITNAICDDMQEILRWHLRPPVLEGTREIANGWNPYLFALTSIFDYMVAN